MGSQRRQQPKWTVGRRVGSQQPGARLVESDITVILRQLKRGLKQNFLARLYGVSESTISRIKTGKDWRHVPR